MIKAQFLLLNSILKTRIAEVYPNAFVEFRIMLNCPDTAVNRSFMCALSRFG